MWLAAKAKVVLGNKDNVVNLLLVGAFAAIGARSVSQQREIDALETERDSILTSNRHMQKSMWEWRQALFDLYHRDPSASPISLSKLREIYGEPEEPSASPEGGGGVYALPALPSMRDDDQGINPEHGTTDPTSRIAV